MAKQSNQKNRSSKRNDSRNNNGKRLTYENQDKMSRSNSSKNQRRAKEIADSAVDMSKTNDFNWYNAFPQFTKDAGSLAFGIPLGQPIVKANGDYMFIPGIMSLQFYPGIGYSKDMSSPINRSAVRFYTYLRNIQKAAAKYDSADVMMYLMALDSCYMFHSLMRRAYGAAQLFTPVNKYYPKQILSLMGFDPSIADDLAAFRAYINQFAISLGSYTVPGNIDIFNRHQWMCEGLYLDGVGEKAQTYMFVPEGFWKFNNTVTTGSQLDFVPWMAQDTNTTTLHTLSQVQAIGKSLINAILNDEDTGNISGDIYSAWGPNGVKKMVETPEGLQVIPVYDETVLSQIENATIMGVYSSSYTPVISQSPEVGNGAIIYTPKFKGVTDAKTAYVNGSSSPSGASLYGQPLFTAPGAFLNMHVSQPTPEQVIEATRLMVDVNTGMGVTTSHEDISPSTMGADVVSRTKIGVFDYTTGNTIGMRTIVHTSNGIYMGDGGPSIEYLALNTVFDWSPMQWVYKLTQNGESGNWIYGIDINRPGADIDNLTYVSATQLEMMHEAVMLSLFNIPQMGM